MDSPSTTLVDYLFSKTNIHVSGACGPKRSSPLECFRPIHQSYHRPVTANQPAIAKGLGECMPGGSLRKVKGNRKGGEGGVDVGEAVVYDRDVVTTWRLPSSMAAYEIFF